MDLEWMDLEWLGFAGTAIVAVAYIPQVGHLLRARCTAGVSLGAYAMWTVAGLLLLSYAISTGNSVFIALQSYQLLAATAILLLSLRHKGRLCAAHCGHEHG